MGGGAERAMVNLANNLTERDLRVDLVLANAGGPYMSQVSPKVQIINLQCPKLPTSLPKLVNTLFPYTTLFRSRKSVV